MCSVRPAGRRRRLAAHEAESATAPVPVTPKANGSSKPAIATPASRAPGRLSETEREALAGYVRLPDAAVRARFGVTKQLFDRAIGGAIMPGEALAHIAAGLRRPNGQA